MTWGKGWEVGVRKEVDAQQRAQLKALLIRQHEAMRLPQDPQRQAYLRQRCTCGSGLADGLCVNCWPQ